ncbi:MAG: Rha family transcriptional regulator [Bacillota bacterium]|jgi:Rha family phage regulatory protein
MQQIAITLDSREVAKMVNKNHAHLLRDIEIYSNYLLNANETKIGLVDFFQKSNYKDSKGQLRPCYNITKKGCELIAHKMTGQKGVLFTAEYINRFHQMEDELKNQPPTAPYEFRPKTYKGQPVVTIDDLAFLADVSRHTIKYSVKKLIKGVDYFLLDGTELVNFKRENSFLSKLIGAITVITKSGFLKLGELISSMPKQLECFKAPGSIPKQLECFKAQLPSPKPRPLIIDCHNQDLENGIQYIRQQIAALEILLNFLHRGNTQSEQDCFAAAVLDTAASILYKSDDLKKIKYNLLPKPL